MLISVVRGVMNDLIAFNIHSFASPIILPKCPSCVGFVSSMKARPISKL